jgi:hypothetical protein
MMRSHDKNKGQNLRSNFKLFTEASRSAEWKQLLNFSGKACRLSNDLVLSTVNYGRNHKTPFYNVAILFAMFIGLMSTKHAIINELVIFTLCH